MRKKLLLTATFLLASCLNCCGNSKAADTSVTPVPPSQSPDGNTNTVEPTTDPLTATPEATAKPTATSTPTPTVAPTSTPSQEEDSMFSKTH